MKTFYRIDYTSGGLSEFLNGKEFITSRYELLEIEIDETWGEEQVIECVDEFYIDKNKKFVDISSMEEVNGVYEYDIGSGTHDEGEYKNKEKAIEEFEKLKKTFK